MRFINHRWNDPQLQGTYIIILCIAPGQKTDFFLAASDELEISPNFLKAKQQAISSRDGHGLAASCTADKITNSKSSNKNKIS